MKVFYLLVLIFILGFTFNCLLAKVDLAGKNIFYNLNSKNKSCNTCHPAGSSAGRWNLATQSIDPDEGKKIPSLKGIGKRKRTIDCRCACFETVSIVPRFKLSSDLFVGALSQIGPVFYMLFKIQVHLFICITADVKKIFIHSKVF